jgi:hypothetical protein
MKNFLLIPNTLKWAHKKVLEKVIRKKLCKFYVFQILYLFPMFLQYLFSEHCFGSISTNLESA